MTTGVDRQIDTSIVRIEPKKIYYYYYYYYYISCHRPILPGNSLEPTVIPTAQASSFTLQYFPYCV
jgi:hypothetical protein